MVPAAYRSYALLVLLLAILASGCTVQTNPLSGRDRVYAYTWEQEIQIGREADQQISTFFGVYDDTALNEYVAAIGERVLAESQMRDPDIDPKFRDTRFTFRVLDSPVVNAFALPGGYIYVTRGLLSHMNNEAQLAVVLGHEVAHVAGRHASRRQATAQLGQLGLLAGAIGAEIAGLPGGDILELGSTAMQLLFLRYSRSDEEEADYHGVAYSAQAGYEAAEGSQFFVTIRRITEEHGQALPTFLSTHPDPGQREQTVRELAAEWRERVPMERINQSGYYNTISNIVLGEDPRQGYVEGQTFYHPDLEFRFPIPANWETINQPTAVHMVGPDQRAAMVLQILDVTSAAAAAAEIAAQQGIRVVDRRSTTVDGNPAQVVIADITQNRQNYRVQFFFIEYGGRVYRFVGYTAQNLFGQYQGAFDQTMNGFARVTDRAVLSVQPTRLRIVAANRTAPFRDFLPNQLPRGMSANDLAIMNQVELTQTIEQGTRLKLP